MRMMSIASGSSGNCIYIGTDNTHILIDDGISRKKVLEGLHKLDLCAKDIDAIFITHDHDDHTKGLGVLERHQAIPLYGTKGTIDFIENSTKFGKFPEGIFHSFFAGEQLTIKDLTINTIRVSHDAIDPVAYSFSCNGKKAGIITDLGTYTDDIVSEFSNMNTILVESNHDVNMLLTGPYPYMLKNRILGQKGHLSNEDCGRLLGNVLNDNMEHVLLGHLSHENNFPDLAYETVRLEINNGDNCYKADDFDIKVARRDLPSDIISI